MKNGNGSESATRQSLLTDDAREACVCNGLREIFTAAVRSSLQLIPVTKEKIAMCSNQKGI